MNGKQPSFQLTDEIEALVAEITKALAKVSPFDIPQKRENRIRTIHASLAIEGNPLTLDQVSAIYDKGRVLMAGRKEAREVKNACSAYEVFLIYDPYEVKDLLAAHKRMMKGIISEKGAFRYSSVGVFEGDMLVHAAPPAHEVPGEIKALLDWCKTSELHPLIKATVFHYEFEFVHPFADGNGRLGRFWQSLMLGKWNEIFYYLPIEERLLKRKSEYYGALRSSDKNSESNAFALMMLKLILEEVKARARD